MVSNASYHVGFALGESKYVPSPRYLSSCLDTQFYIQLVYKGTLSFTIRIQILSGSLFQKGLFNIYPGCIVDGDFLLSNEIDR